jgi:hypothetical protein
MGNPSQDRPMRAGFFSDFEWVPEIGPADRLGA